MCIIFIIIIFSMQCQVVSLPVRVSVALQTAVWIMRPPQIVCVGQATTAAVNNSKINI